MQKCNGCGFSKPKSIKLDNGKYVVKCPQCGMNTGPQKTCKRAENLWNQNHRFGGSTK